MGEKQEFTEMRVHRGFLAVHRNGKRIPNEEVVNLLNSQSAEIAGLRKACRGILAATKGKRLNDYDRIPIPTADLIALHEALGNPSEIPNSSEFLVTEAEAALHFNGVPQFPLSGSINRKPFRGFAGGSLMVEETTLGCGPGGWIGTVCLVQWYAPPANLWNINWTPPPLDDFRTLEYWPQRIA